MCIVRLRTAELIVWLRWARAIGCWTTRKILKLTPPAVVAKVNVELAVWTKTQHATVVISACRLFLVTLIRRHRRAVVLKRAQHDQVVIES